MKKLLGIVVLGLLLCGNAFSEIINLKCLWNSGYALPEEDMSSNKGKVDFYKIDLDEKEVIDSPSGKYHNFETETSKSFVHVDDDQIYFGIRAKQGTSRHTFTINRNTGVLNEYYSINTDNLKGIISNKFLCEKTTSKKKF